jgi:DNA-binding NarL/FixJ family response regulator
MQMNKLRIFLAEDHSIVREGLKLFINKQQDMEVIGEASTGETAYQLAIQLHPDIVLMDISMPDMSGALVTRQLLKHSPDIKVLALSIHENRGYLKALLEAGASGYVLKRASAEDLIQAIHIVAHGGIYIDSNMTSYLVDTILTEPASELNSTKKKLSQRESEVARMIAQGYTNREIAGKMKVSIKTVETYKYRVMDKLGLGSRVDFVRYAVHNGWMSEF